MHLAWLAGPFQGALVAPSRCAVCGAWPAQPLCAGCSARFTLPVQRCSLCALPLPTAATVCGACVREPPPLDACFAAVPYAYPWAGLVGRFKFQQEPGWAATFGRQMRAVDGLADAVAGADLLLPMPLAPRRLAERGFNQALLLARALDSARTDARLLLRLRETGSQTALDRKSREANVRNAFGLEPLRAAEVRGRAVLLVDDVMTSGASLHAAAKVLRQAGARRVSAAVLARTDAPS
jgi:ComF family protein